MKYDEPKKVKVEEKTIQELVCCVLISPRDCSAVSNLFDITYADSYGNQIPAEGYQKQFSKFFKENSSEILNARRCILISYLTPLSIIKYFIKPSIR